MQETISKAASLNGRFFAYLYNERADHSIEKASRWLASELKSVFNAGHVAISCYYSANVPLLPYFTASTSSDRTPAASSQDDREELFENGFSKKTDQCRMLIGDPQKEWFAVLEMIGADLTAKDDLMAVSTSCSNFLFYCREIEMSVMNSRKHTHLYELTERFHSSMDKDQVLFELIEALQSMYSSYIFYLFLSHDNDSRLQLPTKDLYFDEKGSTDSAMEAFLTGTIKMDRTSSENIHVFVPLKGRQGIYGVLEVISDKISPLKESEIKFIMMLANAAGNAMENAQLYQQSRKVIEDLRLINETSHQLNKNMPLKDTMKFLSERIIYSFNAQEAGFFYKDSSGSYQLLPGSTGFFITPEAESYLSFVQTKIINEKEGIFIGNLSGQNMSGLYRCLMAVPMMENEQVRGFAIAVHETPYHFTFETFKLLQSLIHHSTLALTNSMLREELEALVKTDNLTKLFSRNYLNERIRQSMSQERNGVFILIDIDNFKRINDTYGHQTGDEVLIQVGNIIKSNVREHDVGARWGGEELAIYLPQVEVESGIAVANRLVKRVRKITSPSITVSCGISWWEADRADTPKQLFLRADRALYKAKSNGKDQVVVQADSQK
ncbi:diguanylate cyclase [Metabacillus sp. KIGAM252]|uniref:Diguanylate cyclase n=1 Tax=Metabacillus flavus TaxID=2823519 RepID=A0ABS5LHI5_9BACI|nr:sensor domain-containing diguanylate cyclase [Metabacillus flavus]MBS2970028.1 diguanylate cyclase [Metabacillus flavus]